MPKTLTKKDARKNDAKKRRKFKIFIALLIVFSLVLGILLGSLLNLKINEIEGIVPSKFLDTSDYEKVISINIEPPTLMLATKCSVLEMNITDDQIYSIAFALENLTSPRPLTHDIMKSILDNYNINILQIRIDSTTPDKIYKAKIILREGNKILVLDSRPSDATALSLRTGKDIWIKKDILNEFAEKIC
jgi:bifunctional DNase/RNase